MHISILWEGEKYEGEKEGFLFSPWPMNSNMASPRNQKSVPCARGWVRYVSFDRVCDGVGCALSLIVTHIPSGCILEQFCGGDHPHQAPLVPLHVTTYLPFNHMGLLLAPSYPKAPAHASLFAGTALQSNLANHLAQSLSSCRAQTGHP